MKVRFEFIMRCIPVNGSRNSKKSTIFKATIIPILLLSDKTVMSFSHGDQILRPVYITIGNQDAKT